MRLQERIKSLAPDVDPRYVEAWMRSEHGTLDAMSPAQFTQAARVARECAIEAGSHLNRDLAKSFGL